MLLRIETFCLLLSVFLYQTAKSEIVLYRISDRILYLGRNLVDWVTANEECLKLNMVLASAKSDEDNSALAEFIKPRSYVTWIGGYNYQDNSQWRWIEDGELFNYTNWLENSPNSPSTKNCLQILKNPLGKWIADTCRAKRRFICELVKRDHSE